MEIKPSLKSGAWYFLSITLIAIFIAFRYLKYVKTGGDWLTIFYLSVTMINHFAVLAFLVFLLFYVPIAWFIKSLKFRIAFISLLATVGLILLLLDTYIYDLYRFHINGFVLNLVFGGAFSEIFIFDNWMYFKAILFFMVAYLLLYFLARVIFRLYDRNLLKGGKTIFWFILFSFISCQLLHAWSYAVSYRKIQQASLYFPLFYPLKANKLLSSMGIATAASEQNWSSIQNENEQQVLYPLKPLSFERMSEKPLNILFIVVDAWQYETFNDTVSPHIKRFSHNKLVFNHHYSGSNGTRGGIFSLFYGLPPLYWDDFLINRITPVFLNHLQQTGYETEILASAALVSPEFDKTVFYGMDNLRTRTPGEHFYERDVRITDDFKSFLDTATSRKPFFGFLFYDSPHNYNLPPQLPHPFKPYWENVDHSVLHNDFDREPFYNSYKATVWYCDSLINSVLLKLEEKKLLENTIVVITSDHGQEFNENKHNYWGHTSNFSKYQLQVPLIISWPGKNPAQFNYFTSHYDIVPTLLNDYFKCTNPMSDYSFGKSLFDTIPQRVFVAGSKEHFAFIDLDKKQINTVFFNGSLSVTDMHLNELNVKPDATLLNEQLLKVQRFYKN
jgi:membrane-anchored protein YejM (alkaline phosphatase superfamily)